MFLRARLQENVYQFNETLSFLMSLNKNTEGAKQEKWKTNNN